MNGLGCTIPSIARLTESTAIQDAAATPPPAAISHYTLFTNQGIKYPFAAAGGPANKTPLLRNVALVVRLILLNASVQRIRHTTKRRCFPASPFCLRRVRDSNPRTREGQRFSRPPRSTTLPTLRGKNTTFFRFPYTPPKNFYSRLLFNILSYICKENNIFLFIL